MTLEELERANELAREIHRLQKYAEWWNKSDEPLDVLLRDSEEWMVDNADAMVFREATRKKIAERLEKKEREFQQLGTKPLRKVI